MISGCREWVDPTWWPSWTSTGQNLDMTDESWTPDFDTLVAELRQVRERGIPGLRELRPKGLAAVARQVGLVTSEDSLPAAIEDVLRQAVDIFGGGIEQDVAEFTFGLAQGWRSRPAYARRQKAAEASDLTVDSFRKEPERRIILEMAEGVLAVAREGAMRETRLAMEQRRHPADSRLAVQWVERFEAYYRIWTPASGLAGDLLAAINMYRQEPSEHLPWDPNSEEPFDPVEYGQYYVTLALVHYARFLVELRRFVSRHGGLWLLSDVEKEQEAADAIYRIGWHNNMNEDDDSWLRRNLVDARHEENEHFVQLMVSTTMGTRVHRKWQDFGRSCHCQDVEHGDGPECQVHATIKACQDYMTLIDEDWLKIADWYRPGSTPVRSVQPEDLYAAHVHAIRNCPETSKG